MEVYSGRFEANGFVEGDKIEILDCASSNESARSQVGLVVTLRRSVFGGDLVFGDNGWYAGNFTYRRATPKPKLMGIASWLNERSM